MSGRFMELDAGLYTLNVRSGAGPAGVHRTRGSQVRVDRHGGRVVFKVPEEERVYVWWRGSGESPELEFSGSGPAAAKAARHARPERRRTA